MNYVYDILLNFNDELFDFYDWNMRDLIDHIRKIPIFKVTKEVLDDFFNYDIKLGKEFKEKIEDKTEIFFGRKVKNIPYAFLLTDSKKVIALKEKDGKLLISDLLLDEEEVALEMLPLLSITEIPYTKNNKKQKQVLKTRKEQEIEEKLKKSIHYLKEEKNLERLKYIYYECFNKKENIKEKILNDFQNKLNSDFFNFSKKLDYLLKITEKTV